MSRVRYERRGGSMSKRVWVTGPNGARKQVRVTGRNEAEVRDKVAELRVAAKNGTLADAGLLTIAEYVERWLEHAATRVRPRTLLRYEGLLRGHVLPVIGGVRMSKVRAAHVQSVIDGVLRDGLSKRTALHTYRVLSSALRQAVRWQLLTVNPATAVSPPRPDRPQLHIPNAEEVGRILTAAETTALRMPVTLAVATGARAGELLALRWREVDLDAGLIRVTASLQWARGTFHFAEPKTSRARRTVMLPPFAIEALRAHRRAQAQRRLAFGEGWTDLDLVLDVGDGSPLRTENLSSSFHQLVGRAGLAGVRFHDLRHAYATALLKANVHPKIVSESLGHSSIVITMDTYSHVLPSMGDVAAEALQRAYAGVLPTG